MFIRLLLNLTKVVFRFYDGITSLLMLVMETAFPVLKSQKSQSNSFTPYR